MVNFKPVVLAFASTVALVTFQPDRTYAQHITWKLNNINRIGNTPTTVLGKPVVNKEDGHEAIAFNGADDGVVVTSVPAEGWKQFTIEVLFKPDGDGPAAPRFIHFQDKDDNRGTFEIRLNHKKQWYMDTFLKNGKAGDKGLALIDSTLLHPANRWYWVAMVYDGKNMTSYVNGVKEKEGTYNFPGLGSAQIAMGVRLNKVGWFKGQISEIRFHHTTLSPDALQKIGQ